MTIAALVISAVALLVSVVTAAALIELHEGLEVVRGLAGFRDEVVSLDLPGVVSTRPSEYGLPAHLDNYTGLVLFLSPSCASCFEIARSLRRKVPDGLHIVVTAADIPTSRKWLEDFSIPINRCSLDHDRRIVDSLGISSTPVALHINDGAIAHATTVPSGAWLKDTLNREKVEASP